MKTLKLQAWCYLILIHLVMCTFVDTSDCAGVTDSQLNLEKILIDVALDKTANKLKFFMNTKVTNEDLSITSPLIVDVNTTTNKYTTFHAQIWYRGKEILSENKRFCDMVGVKNTTEYQRSPRFRQEKPGTKSNPTEADIYAQLYGGVYKRYDGPAAEETSNPFHGPPPGFHHQNESHNGVDADMAHTNKTIESLFLNSTGELIGCPLYVNDSIYMYYEVDISDYSSLGSFKARFAVISNDENSLDLGCVSTYITPAISKVSQRAVLYCCLLLLLFTEIINFLTTIYSSYQESTNPFLFTASTICNENLLRQLDATVQSIVLYLQFALFTAGLNLRYPGFYQPMLALLKWCALLGFSVVSGNTFFSSTEQDNIYLTYQSGGLKALSYYGNYKMSGINWSNFILTLLIWICIQIVAQAVYYGILSIRRSATRQIFKDMELISTLSRGYSMILGLLLNNVMVFFGYPFLIFTSFLFSLSQQGRRGHLANINMLKYDAFARNVSYDMLFSPVSYSYFQNHLNETIPPPFNGTMQNNTSFADWKSHHKRKFGSEVGSAPLVIGAILFAFWFITAFYFVFKYLVTVSKWKISVNKNVSKLYTSVSTLLTWSFFYHQYQPGRNYFVIFDLASMVIRLLIISLAQSSGLAQVVCIVVLDFCNVILLLLLRPYFLSFSLLSPRLVIPVAKFVVSILCVPFLEELNMSEVVRTNVAYAQLVIHGVIAVVFLCQLFLCIIRTIFSIIKYRRQKKDNLDEKLANVNSLDDFNGQFEYKPLEHLLKPIKEYSFALNPPTDDMILNEYDSFSMDQSLAGDADFYYRANSFRRPAEKTRSDSGKQDHESILTEYSSFEKQQEIAARRKSTVDYTTREADKIYKKYFVDDGMDSDIKQLWEARFEKIHLTKKVAVRVPENTKTTSSGFMAHLKGLFVKAPEVPEQKGFEVSRPRPLVVKIPSKQPQNDTLERNASTKTTKTIQTARSSFDNESESHFHTKDNM